MFQQRWHIVCEGGLSSVSARQCHDSRRDMRVKSSGADNSRSNASEALTRPKATPPDAHGLI